MGGDPYQTHQLYECLGLIEMYIAHFDSFYVHFDNNPGWIGVPIIIDKTDCYREN
jgi:hypothetical protein